jgi:hypothetical protein
MTTIDLAPFCFVDNVLDLSCPELAEPFHRGPYTLASDNNILVRVLRRDAGEDDTGPDTTHHEQQIIHEGLSPLPAVLLPKPTRCEKCHGIGKVVHCDCAAFDDACEFCNFTRGLPATDPDAHAWTCSQCLGHKVAYPMGDQVYLTPVLAIAPHYYALLSQLPDVRVDLSVDSTGHNARGISFSFAGGDGLVMPLETRPIEHAPAYVAEATRRSAMQAEAFADDTF